MNNSRAAWFTLAFGLVLAAVLWFTPIPEDPDVPTYRTNANGTVEKINYAYRRGRKPVIPSQEAGVSVGALVVIAAGVTIAGVVAWKVGGSPP